MSTAVVEKKETKLTPAFALWARRNEKGFEFLTGKPEGDKETKLVAFFNRKKKAMKSPDILVYRRAGESELEEFASLWANASNSGKKYLSGNWNGQRVVGFFNEQHKVSQPYITVYFSEKE